MFETLYVFLIRHKQIELPEIGAVTLEPYSAKTRFIDREVLPPGYSFAFSQKTQASANRVTGWIAYTLGISETEAISRFNNFIEEIKMRLQDGNEVMWKGVGTFSKDLMNEIKFEPQKKAFAFQEPVIAEKVIRENAKHAVLVGEREKTASEYSEIIEAGEEITPATNWWIWPVALIVLSLIFIGWYFSENGVKASSSSNTEKSTPKTAPSGFYYSK